MSGRIVRQTNTGYLGNESAPRLKYYKIVLVSDPMNTFSIRDIENLCGIKAHTLRVWEQRYQIISPRRKAGNHRLYDNNDLKYLLQIAYLYHHGHKISFLARLDEKALCELALQMPQAGTANEIFISHLIGASIDFDQELFDRVLHNIILHMGFEKAVTQVVYPFLKKIGLLWLTGNVIPAQEHFASELIIKKLEVAIHGLENPISFEDGRNILLYTPSGEFHEIPLLYMRYLMKKNGAATVYFGKNVALEELHYYCSHRRVSHLYFHLVTNIMRCEPDQYLKKLTDLFPGHHIVISGSLGEGVKGIYPRVRILKSLDEMLAFAKEQ
jgi:MerR family transcriptional regulator, light-induced transcriptional regulator